MLTMKFMQTFLALSGLTVLTVSVLSAKAYLKGRFCICRFSQPK